MANQGANSIREIGADNRRQERQPEAHRLEGGRGHIVLAGAAEAEEPEQSRRSRISEPMRDPPAHGKTCQRGKARKEPVLQLAHGEPDEQRELASYPVTGARKGNASERSKNLRPLALALLEPVAKRDHLARELGWHRVAERVNLVLETVSCEPLIARTQIAPRSCDPIAKHCPVREPARHHH